MIGGKKATARGIVYGALEDFAGRVKTDSPLEAFEQALENAKPSLEVKTRESGERIIKSPLKSQAIDARRWLCSGSSRIPAQNRVGPWRKA